MLHYYYPRSTILQKGSFIQIPITNGDWFRCSCPVRLLGTQLYLFLVVVSNCYMIKISNNLDDVCTVLLQCVGTDRNIPDVVLDTRITTLFRLLRFYHLDFETLSIKAKDTFSEKLHQVFETYLPILQYSSNIFGSIPTFNLPKVIILL